MAQQRQASSQFKEEPGSDSHQAHHQQQGPPPSQYPRPPSVVHQHAQGAPSQTHPSGAYPSSHHVYQQPSQDPYYGQQSPYSTPGATSGYTSADTGEMMAATMQRPPYPPMSYHGHTPQTNSPASVASPSGHDQQRNMYAQPASQLHQQSMYYAPQQHGQYGSISAQTQQSPYAQHPQQSQQTMTSQPNMMMPAHSSSANHQMSQHNSQHAQPGMTGSPRHTKIEAHGLPPQIPPSMQQRPAAPGPLGQSQANQNGAPLSTPTGSAPGVNPNAAPGPIPATTPLVVRQDTNGVQWIAFEYSRDRVKMEYTIRCDVESVVVDELPSDFKTENCVYPRACCAKDQYRGNRLQYETECNTVGWALAQLNPALRGKRGLIQRAVDSWRNSNQDPRLRSRRVRRMAKITNRGKQVPNASHPGHMGGPGGPGGPAGMSAPSSMGPGGGSTAMGGKPSMSNMSGQMHHHHHHQDGAQEGEVGDGDYIDDQQHHHHHQAPGTDERPSQVFSGYGQYGSGHPGQGTAGSSSSMPSIHDALGSPHQQGAAIAARRLSKSRLADGPDGPEDLFPDIPEAKKRKFILVEDSDRQSRLRVRVILEGVDTREIPDSFRKGSSVYPRSYFPREMQSPPPSATGSKFFQDDLDDNDMVMGGGHTDGSGGGVEDDGNTETEGRHHGPGGKRSDRGSLTTMVKVPIAKGQEVEVAIPRIRKAARGKEVRLNDLAYRMAWLQSRVFAGRTVFLQKALDSYRNKIRIAIESTMQDVKTVAPHYETRVGKRRWNERMRRGEKKDDE